MKLPNITEIIIGSGDFDIRTCFTGGVGGDRQNWLWNPILPTAI